MEEFDNTNGMLKKIEKVIKDSYHPTADELGNYILYKNGIEPERSILKLIPVIDLHLRKCNGCNKLFLELNNEYSELDTFLNNQESLRKENIPVPAYPIKKSQVNYFKYTGIGLAIAFILYIGAFSISRFVTPVSVKYAALENTSDLYETRGRVTDEFQESLKAFENRDYNGTINWLNKDIVNNRGVESIFYSYYLLGLANLESAQSDVLGLFPSYDKSKVKIGISALNKSLELNNSGRFRNINLDIYFYLAKADLMLNNITDAKYYLNKVVYEKGSNMNEAKKILSELD